MDRVAVAGLSLQHTDVEGLERAKRGLAGGGEPPAKLLADELGASETVCLSTCNRLELYFARESGHAPGRADLELLARTLGLAPRDVLREQLFLHAGERAVRHLFRVASSLDSLVLGEGEILSQVRAAYEDSQALGLTGRLLRPIFEQALQVGKKARSRTDLARHPVSVVSLGVAFLAERLGQHAPAARIAVLGAGATGTHAARALRGAGLAVTWIANRSPARAAALAAEVGARPLALDAFRSGAAAVDALVSATSAPEPVLDAAALLRLAERTPGGRPLLAVDLALPRDLEPIEHARLERIDLVALRSQAERNRAQRAAAAAEAELLIEAELETLGRSAAEKPLLSSFAALLAEAREAFELELARLSEGRLARLAPAERAAVERWARAAFGRLGHVPLSALKRLARADALPRGEWEGLE